MPGIKMSSFTMEKVFTALIDNNVSEMQKLLSSHRHKKFDINSTLIGNIKLINVAAQHGLVEALDILKINGASFVTEKSPIHPLFTAVAHNQMEVSIFILEGYLHSLHVILDCIQDISLKIQTGKYGNG